MASSSTSSSRLASPSLASPRSASRANLVADALRKSSSDADALVRSSFIRSSVLTLLRKKRAPAVLVNLIGLLLGDRLLHVLVERPHRLVADDSRGTGRTGCSAAIRATSMASGTGEEAGGAHRFQPNARVLVGRQLAEQVERVRHAVAPVAQDARGGGPGRKSGEASTCFSRSTSTTLCDWCSQSPSST